MHINVADHALHVIHLILHVTLTGDQIFAKITLLWEIDKHAELSVFSNFSVIWAKLLL